MSNFKYEIVQGVPFTIRVNRANSIMIIKNNTTILQFNNVTTLSNGERWLTINIDQDNFMEAGLAQFQLFENNQLKDQGTLKIVASLLIDPNQDIRSKYAIIIEAIQKQIAGVATKGQKHVQVGDKTIDKYSAAELLSLLTYFKGKLAEEEAGNGINPKTDQMKILYKFTLR